MSECDVSRLWEEGRAEQPSDAARARALAAAALALTDGESSRPSDSGESEHVRLSRRAVRTSGAVAALALAAGVALVAAPSLRHRSGEITAEERAEIAIGGRARAVVEARSHLRWSAPDEVTQTRGNVFYRVDPGAPFRVHTPAGDVEVRGTCFRVKIHEGEMTGREMKAGAAGVLASAAAFVAVYEGKVAVSHAGQSAELAAGEAADMGARGVRKDADASAAERAFDEATTAEGDASDPTLAANRTLVASVGDYRARIERMEVERRALEQQLADARARLDAADGGPSAPKAEITQDEWKELAKTGTIKMRVPCSWKGGWWPPAKKLDELGLAPSDAPALRDASNRLYESSWAAIRPICEKVGGKDIAEKLGLDGCPNFIFNYLRGVDREGAFEQMRRVAEMRAGLRPTPPLDDPSLGPVEKVFLIMTGQQSAIEADLAQSFGPDEAHRLVTSDSFCAWSSTWNGPGPRRDAGP